MGISWRVYFVLQSKSAAVTTLPVPLVRALLMPVGQAVSADIEGRESPAQMPMTFAYMLVVAF